MSQPTLIIPAREPEAPEGAPSGRASRTAAELLESFAGKLARVLVDAGQPTDALAVGQVGLAARPDDPELHLTMGRAWFMLGDLLRAQTALTSAVKLAPADPEGYLWSARVLLRRGDARRAVRMLKRAIPLSPGDDTLLELYARAQLAQLAELGPAQPLAPVTWIARR